MRYEKVRSFGDGTIHGVTVVAFSPNGLYLAAGGKDSQLCIWRISDGKLLHTFQTASPVYSLLWLPGQDGMIVCGMEDGSLSSVLASPSKIKGQNFPRNHNFVVERLAAKGPHLASGALEELAVWRKQRNGQYEHAFDLDLPPRNSVNQDKEVIVTSVHWTESRAHGSVLVVTYMHHGYLIYDTRTWQLAHHVPLNGCIGDASMTPDGTRMVVSNMRSGFDIYDAATGMSLGTLVHPVDQVRAIPVRFVHGGHAVLGGSTVGAAHLWDAASCRMHQPLAVEADAEVLAIAAHYDPSHDRFFIATGVTHPSDHIAVALWVAAEQGLSGRSRLRSVVGWCLPGPDFCSSVCYLLYGLIVGTVAMSLAIMFAAHYIGTS